MRKDPKLLPNFVFFLGLLLVGTTGANSASLVTNLSLEKKGDFTYFTIFAEDNIEFTHFILSARDDKPHRIVVDLQDAIHRLPKHNFRALPPGTVNAIRTSQYQVEPKKITRIVLDLKGPVIYRVTEQEKENEITLAISTKKDPPSISWAADLKTQKAKEKKVKGRIVAKRKDREELVRQEPVSPLETDPSKPKIKSKIKTDRAKPEEEPKDLSSKVEASWIKKTERATTPTEIKKEKGKQMVEKGIEMEAAAPEAEVVMEPLKKDKSEGSKPLRPEVVPAVSMDTTVLQETAFTEFDREKKGVAARETLVYLSEERRDPFVPLSEKIDFEFGELPLPAVENLKLVGTLEDRGGYKALLEDEGGYGYLLKAGDRVKNGSVVSVFKNKIFFQIEEYGWERTISLELPPEY